MKALTYSIFFLCSFMVTAQNWEVSYSEALTKSKEQEKPIVLIFSGSDWCTPCIKLERSIWQSEEFTAYADKNYILYKADFPRKKNNQLPEVLTIQNKALAAKFNPKGYFPLVLLIDSTEKVLGETGYQKITPLQYISHLNSFLE